MYCHVTQIKVVFVLYIFLSPWKKKLSTTLVLFSKGSDLTEARNLPRELLIPIAFTCALLKYT